MNEECIDHEIWDTIGEDIQKGVPMKHYFEPMRLSSAAFAPIDEDELFAQIMGNDVKRFSAENKTAQKINNQSTRFESRSLWLVEEAVIPFRIDRKLCKSEKNFHQI